MEGDDQLVEVSEASPEEEMKPAYPFTKEAPILRQGFIEIPS